MLDEGIYFNVKKKKIHLRRVHKKASLLTRIPVFLSKILVLHSLTLGDEEWKIKKNPLRFDAIKTGIKIGTNFLLYLVY